MKRRMNVLFAAFEAVPFMKTGGLGDVAGSLPEALNGAGCDARVIMPNFSGIPQEYRDEMVHLCDFYVPLAWRNLYCGIETLTRRGVTYYFVDNEYYFNRGSAYGYFDDGERIAFFSKAVVEAIQYLPDVPVDILHANDWHTALSPVFLREFYRGIEAYDRIKTVFTVHNLKFQGQMSDYVLSDVIGLAGIPAAADQLRMDKDSIDFMKGALCYSDVLTTVSPTYTEEVQRPFFGEHLDGIFRRVSLGRVIVPTDSADAGTRKKYADYAASRHERTLKPQGERRTLFPKDLVGTSEQILEQLFNDPIVARVGELRLELPYEFQQHEYQQILSDFISHIAPEIGWGNQPVRISAGARR